MGGAGYSSSSSRGSTPSSTPSPRNSKSYLEPLSIQKGMSSHPLHVLQHTSDSLPLQTHITNCSPEPKYPSSHTTRYNDNYLAPQHTTVSALKHHSSSSTESYSSKHHSSSRGKSDLKPLSVDYPKDSDKTVRSDKTTDTRYHPHSYLDQARDAKKQRPESRKHTDPKFHRNSAYYWD